MLSYFTNNITNCIGVSFDGADYTLTFDDDSQRLATVAEILSAAKAQKLTEIRAEANTIIEAKWPVWKQNNCNMGVYPATTLVECQSDIASVIQASNTAEDQVDAATTTTEVEAVTPMWPVI